MVAEMNRLAIGIDANEANLVQNRVGSNQLAFGLLKALYQSNGNYQFTIYLSTPPQADMPKPTNHWNYRVIPPPKLWTQWRLPLDLYFHRPRPGVFLSLGHYVPRFSPVPRIVTITDLGFLKFPNQFTKKDLWQLKYWTSYSIKRAAHIITISKATKADIVKHYGVNLGNITVVYPSYDKALFNESRKKKKESSETLKKYSITKPYLLFLGSLRPSKNIERLITSFSLLENQKLNLVLAGKKGWLYDSIFRKVSELKFQKRVIFPGFISQKDLPYIMCHAEVFVFPSLYEGFGIPVLEAMGSGIPVVASNVASLPEVVGNAGVIVNPYDVNEIAWGIERALKNKTEFRHKGLDRINFFDWKKSAQKVIDILKKFSK